MAPAIEHDDSGQPQPASGPTVPVQPPVQGMAGPGGDKAGEAAPATRILIAVNRSSVPGYQYFSVYPPPIFVTPPQRQTPVPLVSSATVAGTDEAVARMTWRVGADALAFVAVPPGGNPQTATRMTVTPGATLSVAWVDGNFAISTQPADAGTEISVGCSPDIPAGSRIGLVVGPGMLLVPVPPGGGTLTLKPNLGPQVKVQFGTPGDPGFSDVGRLQQVTFEGESATVIVGLDNLIVQQR